MENTVFSDHSVVEYKYYSLYAVMGERINLLVY